MTKNNASEMDGKKNEDQQFFRAIEQFDKQLDVFRLPTEVDLVLGWIGSMPLPLSWASLIVEQHRTIKTISSTFSLPKFGVKQIQFYKSYSHLKNRIDSMDPNDFDDIAKDGKKTFFSMLAAMIAGLKLPRLLDKTRVLDLSKISKSLPATLAKGECFFSLISDSVKIADTAWILNSQLRNENASLVERMWNPSPKMKKDLLELCSNSFSALSSSISAASLFLKWSAHPYLSVAVSTLSTMSSLMSQGISCDRWLWGTQSADSRKVFASLPA